MRIVSLYLCLQWFKGFDLTSWEHSIKRRVHLCPQRSKGSYMPSARELKKSRDYHFCCSRRAKQLNFTSREPPSQWHGHLYSQQVKEPTLPYNSQPVKKCGCLYTQEPSDSTLPHKKHPFKRYGHMCSQQVTRSTLPSESHPVKGREHMCSRWVKGTNFISWEPLIQKRWVGGCMCTWESRGSSMFDMWGLMQLRDCHCNCSLWTKPLNQKWMSNL